MSLFANEEWANMTVKSFLIPADKVAHVQVDNYLDHALLVLTKTGYSAIPVLDTSYKLHGLIGMTMIMDAILGVERIEFERIETMKVEEVMNRNIPRLRLDDRLWKAVGLIVNHPFVCVENEEGYFEGIFTRREILKQLNKQLRRSNQGRKLL
ncbi:c-di-AMP-binding protein CbpB [Geobacillus stearothermophilus]|uniref:cyclic-di-AMP-binding protein CbpB n=1 Tax=Geobacillus stearothermophilus TaxID=1422 RepID=UPI002E23EF91|nr:cyclic-di-AMP-binding protein CbpB [Geobacillus stearothermophilus]MED3843435.1 CBS domain-containing protein [Geobacillus stearothermophilus]MED4357841.1 c-di-AMP-binding protein CbpB [Geobacillus stearothermophilus]